MEPKPGIFLAGNIEGQAVTDVCLDTGCTRTMVREDLAPAEKLLEGDSIAICCAHGDTVVYPLARIQVDMKGSGYSLGSYDKSQKRAQNREEATDRRNEEESAWSTSQ